MSKSYICTCKPHTHYLHIVFLAERFYVFPSTTHEQTKAVRGEMEGKFLLFLLYFLCLLEGRIQQVVVPCVCACVCVCVCGMRMCTCVTHYIG